MTVQQGVGLLVLVLAAASIYAQWRAMHRTAFIRSMFISWSAVVMGWLVGLLPTIAAAIVSIPLLLFGFGMMAVLGMKSWQVVRARRRTMREQGSGADPS
ncbi:hypothetical protein GCM10025857_20810 [Alicyclobacillus contaminans]|uniref:hypothetical protein n=1 Tax=Alicyclobacillus contaminans TaxID=392016 RepID=UPI0004059738|nr:hypothetical protein [Alicyclobacillus contaminans]GMA50724.1 hypothetical protein GCM10025857_20810 [Alicyclobacillus contaminans]